MPLKHIKRKDFVQTFHYKRKGISLKKAVTRREETEKPDKEQKTL